MSGAAAAHGDPLSRDLERALCVGIDGRVFTFPAGGVRRYVGGLLPALLSLDDAPELVALGGDPQMLPSGMRHVPAPWHPPTNAGWVLVGLPRAAARAGVDVIHAHNLLPEGLAGVLLGTSRRSSRLRSWPTR